jgi:hypothetical protein
MSNVYGKVDISNGLQKVVDIGGSGLSGIVIGNDSGFTCIVTLEGANIRRTLYAGTADFIPIPANQVWSGNLIIKPSADLNNISFWPGSFVYIDTFGTNEKPSGTYPMNLNRTGNIGNQVTTVSGSSTSVQNDNNPAATEFIEATVLGSPTSNEAHFVDGSGWIGRWVNPTFTKVFQWFSAGATALQLGATGLLTEILGGAKVDQNLTVVGSSSLDNGAIVTDGAGTVTTLAATTANITTANITTANVSGVLSANGGMKLPNAVAIQAKDSGGTARTIEQVDASNNLQFFGITGKDVIQFLTSAGVLAAAINLLNGSLDLSTTKTTTNGGTAGTAEMWMPLQGPALKVVLIKESGFRTAAGNQDVSFPVPFVNGCIFISTDAVTWSFLKAGVVQSCNVVTAFGTASFQATVTNYTFGQLAPVVAADGIRHNGGAGSNHTGWILMIGN